MPKAKIHKDFLQNINEKTISHNQSILYSTLLILFSFLSIFSLNAQAIKVEVLKTENGYQFLRGGQPYYVIGAGGETHLDVVKKIGGNSIRTWGVDNAQEILDNAQKNGLTVMLGFWVQHERHGFDYNNEEKVKKQLEHFKRVIDQFKNHPALLMWGIGNEVDLFYSNPKVWNAIQDIAKYAHQVDPNHPTSTVTAGLDSLEVDHIKQRAPDIDVYCVNTYGDIGNVPNNIYKYGWTGPYMITEWGPNGHWESPTTSWGAAIEQSSTEKSDVYFTRYKKYIEAYKNRCLGSYVFLWGQKQEYTLTWYGLFTKDQMQTEAIDALEIAWTGKNPTFATPTITSFTINNKKAIESPTMMANTTNFATAITPLNCYQLTNCDSSDKQITYKILRESSDKKAGGDVENEAEEVPTKFKVSKSGKVIFDAPNETGAYRLFVTIIYKEKVAYANCPFTVTPNPKRGNGKKVWLKKWEMGSFE